MQQKHRKKTTCRCLTSFCEMNHSYTWTCIQLHITSCDVFCVNVYHMFNSINTCNLPCKCMWNYDICSNWFWCKCTFDVVEGKYRSKFVILWEIFEYMFVVVIAIIPKYFKRQNCLTSTWPFPIKSSFLLTNANMHMPPWYNPCFFCKKYMVYILITSNNLFINFCYFSNLPDH